MSELSGTEYEKLRKEEIDREKKQQRTAASENKESASIRVGDFMPDFGIFCVRNNGHFIIQGKSLKYIRGYCPE